MVASEKMYNRSIKVVLSALNDRFEVVALQQSKTLTRQAQCPPCDFALCLMSGFALCLIRDWACRVTGFALLERPDFKTIVQSAQNDFD